MREGEGFAGGDAQTEGLLLGLVGVRGRERERMALIYLIWPKTPLSEQYGA